MWTSMTGFGQVRYRGDLGEAVINIRSVNGRSFKLTTKLPESLAPFAPKVEALVRDYLVRGTIDLQVKVRLNRPEKQYRIDREALVAYAREVSAVRKQLKLEGPVSVEQLVELPGVLVEDMPSETEESKLEKLLLELVEQAVEKLVACRNREGKVLHKQFKTSSKRMRKVHGQIGKYADSAVAEYAEKLRERMQKLMNKVGAELDDELVVREAAVFADRSDITEELVRFGAHLDELDRHLEKESPLGRNLEFLLQEMLREANTTASKSANEKLNKGALELKSTIDSLREQVLNVE
ncbi:MAG: YicC/YloC family endoribonuclease [Planctomycetota bacterium]